MTLTEQIQDAMKSAMKEKNQAKLAAVRAIKAEILKEQTSGKGTEVTDADVLKLIQKMIKQRTDSIAIYQQQGRQDSRDCRDLCCPSKISRIGNAFRAKTGKKGTGQNLSDNKVKENRQEKPPENRSNRPLPAGAYEKKSRICLGEEAVYSGPEADKSAGSS